MKKLFRLVLVSSLCLLCFSCYYDEIQEIPEVPDLPPGVEVSFTIDIEPIFSEDTNDCTVCHPGTTGLNPDLRPGRAYNAIVPAYVNDNDFEDPVNSEFYQNLPGIGHPTNAGFELDEDQLILIKGWISQGAQNN